MTAVAAFHVAACVNEFYDICFSMLESSEKSTEKSAEKSAQKSAQNCAEMKRANAADGVSVSYPVE